MYNYRWMAVIISIVIKLKILNNLLEKYRKVSWQGQMHGDNREGNFILYSVASISIWWIRNDAYLPIDN